MSYSIHFNDVFCHYLFRKSLKTAKKQHDSHMSEIRELEKELETVEQKRAEFEEQIEQESQSQGRDLELEESQVRICSFVIG